MLVISDCHTDWVDKQQIFIFSQIWRLGDHEQGDSTLRFWREPYSWLEDGCLLSWALTWKREQAVPLQMLSYWELIFKWIVRRQNWVRSNPHFREKWKRGTTYLRKKKISIERLNNLPKANRWENWILNPGSLFPKLVFLATILSPLTEKIKHYTYY